MHYKQKLLKYLKAGKSFLNKILNGCHTHLVCYKKVGKLLKFYLNKYRYLQIKQLRIFFVKQTQ